MRLPWSAIEPNVERRREAELGARTRRAAHERVGRSELVAATAFLYAILDAAERLREARAFDGSTALPLDKRHALLRAIERLDWVLTLLNGLPPARMAACDRVLRVLAARLDRYEREMRRARRGAPGA